MGNNNALISAGAGLVGGMLGASSARGVNKSNQEFYEEMRATQYQTAVKDMEAAGINPMMAVQNGGAGASPVNATMNPGESASAGLMNAANALVEVPRKQSETAVNQQNAKTGETQAHLNENAAGARASEAKLMDANARKVQDERALLNANKKVAEANAKAIEAEIPYKQTKAEVAGTIKPYAEAARKGGEKLVAAAKAIGTKPADWLYDKVEKWKGSGTAPAAGATSPVYGGSNSAKAYGRAR